MHPIIDSMRKFPTPRQKNSLVVKDKLTKYYKWGEVCFLITAKAKSRKVGGKRGALHRKKFSVAFPWHRVKRMNYIPRSNVAMAIIGIPKFRMTIDYICSTVDKYGI